jgi:hypothetical protein
MILQNDRRELVVYLLLPASITRICLSREESTRADL